MKTKEVIRQLQENDPSGELDVSVGCVDISFIECLPPFYDGTQQILIRTAKGQIESAKYNGKKNKVVIHSMSISDLLFNWPDISIDYSELNPERAAQYKEHDDKVRKETLEIYNKNELEYFMRWAKDKIYEKFPDKYDIEEVARTFFINNLSALDPMTEKEYPNISWVDARNKQWDRELEVYYEADQLLIRKRKV